MAFALKAEYCGSLCADIAHICCSPSYAWYNPCAFAVPALAPGQSYSHLFGKTRQR